MTVKRIEPLDLRVECKACGGHKKVARPLRSEFFVGRQHVQTVEVDCSACAATGMVRPRRLPVPQPRKPPPHGNLAS